MAGEENPEIDARVESYRQFRNELHAAHGKAMAYRALHETGITHPEVEAEIRQSFEQAQARQRELIEANPDHVKAMVYAARQ